MITGNNFIGSTPSKEGRDQLFAYNPENGTAHAEPFAVATPTEIDEAVSKAKVAFESFRSVSSENKADFLDAIAEEIMVLGDALVERACAESGLPAGRIQGGK